MSEHTPGPWKLRKEERPSGIPRIIVGDGSGDIGEVYTCADESFGWPDARLFAGAPELLEVAKEVQKWLEYHADAMPESRGAWPLWERVKNAVSKAESPNQANAELKLELREG